MSKTFYITSDIHSFYTPLKTALDEAGFDINNQDDILIVNGDLFDRGEESVKVLDFIKSIPKERRILIRGNHEYLLRNLLNGDMPTWVDVTNGTLKTVFHLAGIRTKEEDIWNSSRSYLYYQLKNYTEFSGVDEALALGMSLEEFKKLKSDWTKVKNKIKKTGILEWIFDSDEWCDYYELDNFIITHAFIPLYNPCGMSMYNPKIHLLSYRDDWRDLGRTSFEEATWGCPYKFYDAGLFDEEIKKGKTLVVGHWHSYDFRQHYLDIYYRIKEEIDFSIFYTKHLIALDACTAYSKKSNVLVLEETKTGNYIIKK